MSKLLALLIFCFGSLALLCEARASHDYMFSITGVVTAEDGTPLQDAEVNLELDSPVYEGVTPVKAVKRATNGSGGFVFMYTSHKRGVKYTITVRKQGFEPQAISGSAPPAGHHTIRLKRAGGNSGTP